MPALINCLHCKAMIRSDEAYRMNTRRFCNTDCAAKHAEKVRDSYRRAQRKRAVRAAPVVLTVAPPPPAPVAYTNWLDMPLIERADFIIRRGPGFVGCVEEDE